MGKAQAVADRGNESASGQLGDVVAEGERIMTICNACRYCEGFCAVFPAMERRLTFAEADLNYLANLCHNCTECLSACQYEPPHPFAINVPRTLAQIRVRSYEKYSWPSQLGLLYRRTGISLVLCVMCLLLAAMIAATAALSPHGLRSSDGTANFYAVVPHWVLAYTFGAVFLFDVIALLMAVRRYLSDTSVAIVGTPSGGLLEGLRDALSLRYLHGTDEDCATKENSRTPWRRWFHHCTLYGFLLCFAATSVATVYHTFFDYPAPYPWLSLPVILGTLGGIGLIIGPIGLAMSRQRQDPETLDAAQQRPDYAFIFLLVLTSGTGLMLLVGRASTAMGALLMVHLAAVMTLFLTLPYGKFVHGLYRTAALVQYARESRAGTPASGADAAAG
jgi:citrate/tricarballylate utilization protein